jgi:hypothetical protein
LLESQLIELLGQLGINGGDLGPLMSSALLLTILEVITAIPTGRIAKRKGRSMILWVFLALTIPLLPLLFIWILPAIPPKAPKSDS